METPACPPPRDPREKEILDSLVSIRDKLLLLKEDRGSPIRSQDVLPLYDGLERELDRLFAIRECPYDDDGNMLDRVLESCFQLISLAFMTFGRSDDVPAAFALASNVQRLLDHLLEVTFYNEEDMRCFRKTLERLEAVAAASRSRGSNSVNKLLAKRLARIRSDLEVIQQRSEKIRGASRETHDRLIAVLRKIADENTRSKCSCTAVKGYQQELEAIGERIREGEKTPATDGAAEVAELFDFCQQWAGMVLERKGRISESFLPTYEALVRIRNDLEKMTVTQTWSMRETDLFDYQRKLDKFNESRKCGRWVDENGVAADEYTKWTLLYLVRRNLALIYGLLSRPTPVSEALLMTYSQMQTVKACLLEVKRNGGVDSEGEMWPYMMKLESFERMKTDGKFKVKGEVPDGQEALASLLEECKALGAELRANMGKGQDVEIESH